jgi:hypothetical protein
MFDSDCKLGAPLGPGGPRLRSRSNVPGVWDADFGGNGRTGADQLLAENDRFKAVVSVGICV